jgi:hypothetical protein
VSECMPGDSVALPAAVHGSLGLQARLSAEVVQQSIGLELVKVGAICLEGAGVYGRQEAHRLQGEGFRHWARSASCSQCSGKSRGNCQ